MGKKYIYHICTKNSWQRQLDSEYYTHDSLALENFIHCSEKNQIEGVLDRYFKNQFELLILEIDPLLVEHTIKYEMAPIGDMFPHVYGPINKSSIRQTIEIN